VSHRISPRCVLTPDATGTVQRLTLASQRVRLGYPGLPPLTFFAVDQVLGLVGAFADVHRVRTPILVGWGHSLRGLR